MRFSLSILFAILLAPFVMMGQSSVSTEIARSYLVQQHEALGLTLDDVQEVVVTDQYQSNYKGMSHVYLSQTFQGVKVHKALFNVTLKSDNTVLHSGNRFVTDFRSKVTPGELTVSPEKAILSLTQELGFDYAKAPVRIAKKLSSEALIMFAEAPYSTGEMTAEPFYYPVAEGNYKLVWEVFLAEKSTVDSWFAYIDAETGKFISKRQNTYKCKVHAGMFHNHSKCDHSHGVQQASEAELAAAGDGAAYYVVGLPAESPIHGDFELVNEPAIELSSPFGWHDEDGQEGAEWTITRGNNVWAYEDSADADQSAGNEPDGGDDLQFNFPYDETLNPADNMEADVTGLFYMNNMMHDITYLAGFDEPAGAFQNNNYGNGGRGNDQIFAEALDGSGTNNANFQPTADGANGIMQMYRWDFSPGLFRVLDPAIIAGEYENNYVGTGDWNMVPTAEDVDLTGEIVIVADSDPQFPEQGCGELNSDVAGKIAMIYRGSCEFGLKAFNAAEAGAVAAIICNVPGADAPGSSGDVAMGMAPGAFGTQVDIPTLSLGYGDCQKIEAEINARPVTGQIGNIEVMGPTERSSGFDNGVIAHEYGHGVYERLVGGPSNINCTGGAELQGEGFTDYLSLVTTVEPGDQGTDARGIGTFVSGQETTGGGIRNFPYSTDMNICPLTYGSISGGEQYSRGEFIVAVLWDLYWVFSDTYGWDPDLTNLESGNMQAVRLAFAAMKSVPCDPDFIDIRDAILELDGGENTCLLWEMFARRGLGFFADRNDANNGDDATEDFEPLPTCLPFLKVKKEIASLITAGQDVEVVFQVANHTLETATNVTVTDVLEAGMSVASVPAGISFTENGNEVIFELGDLASLEEREFSYTVATDPAKKSITLMINSVETQDERAAWEPSRDFGTANNFWQLNANDARSGMTSYFAQERDEEAKQHLTMKEIPVRGTRPVFRYWHRINTTLVENGGYVQYSQDGVIWNQVNERIIRGEYNSPLTYQNFVIPGLVGFSGSNPTGAFEDSYIELSDFTGELIDMRFVFGTYDIGDDGETTFYGDEDGWFIDDVELMDMVSYETFATISADNADTQTTELIETIVDSDGMVNSIEVLEEFGLSIDLFPNPASDIATLRILSEEKMNARIELTTMSGKALMQKSVEILDTNNMFDLNLAGYSSGIYLVQVISNDRITTKKLIIE